jgi:hypothetical protein
MLYSIVGSPRAFRAVTRENNMTNATTELNKITSIDMPNACAQFELLLEHRDVEDSPVLMGGIGALRDKIHDIWERLEAIAAAPSIG